MLVRTIGPEGGMNLVAVPHPRREVDTRLCASKDARPRRGVDLVAVPHRFEEGNTRFKALRKSPERTISKNSKWTISASGDPGRYIYIL